MATQYAVEDYFPVLKAFGWLQGELYLLQSLPPVPHFELNQIPPLPRPSMLPCLQGARLPGWPEWLPLLLDHAFVLAVAVPTVWHPWDAGSHPGQMENERPMRMEGLVFSPTLPTALAVLWLLLFLDAFLALWWQMCLLWIKDQSGLQASAVAEGWKGW